MQDGFGLAGSIMADSVLGLNGNAAAEFKVSLLCANKDG